MYVCEYHKCQSSSNSLTQWIELLDKMAASPPHGLSKNVFSDWCMPTFFQGRKAPSRPTCSLVLLVVAQPDKRRREPFACCANVRKVTAKCSERV